MKIAYSGVATFGLTLLVGCGVPSAPRPANTSSTPLTTPAGKLDFGWRLSGDRAVAPLQVFSDATHTWLQWLPGQTLPVIVAVNPQGEQVLAYTRQEPYAIIEGHWPSLAFRAGRQRAAARRLSAESVGAPPPVGPVTPLTPPTLTPPTVAQTPIFSVSPADIHLRQALVRWSGLSGWHFQSEYWAIDVDIPLSATANFSDDFVSSVQALVASTELSDRPLQPCFYANQVLRIVSASELCDRTQAPGAPV